MTTTAEINAPVPVHVVEGKPSYTDALIELGDAVQTWKKWLSLARFSIKRRYYTTGLGPFWSLITNSIFIVGICFLYAGAFNLNFKSYLVHLGIGYLIWNLLSDTLGGGGNVFLAEYRIFSELRVNKLGLILKSMFLRYILFLYNFPLFLIIVVLNGDFNLSLFSSLLGLIVLAVTSFFVSYSLSLVSARYRDVPHMVQTITRFAFFFTPILWERKALGDGTRGLIVDLNPFSHFIDIIREPIKSGEIPLHSWVWAGTTLIVSFVVFLVLYKTAHRNIVLYSS